MRSGDWIPKENLIAANIFSGVSWVALGWLAISGAQPGSLPSFGWIHLVALGWLTLASLSVLLHVIAAFLGVKWVGQKVARWGLYLYMLGVVVLVIGFFIPDTAHIEGGAILILLALCLYLVPTSITIARAFRLSPRERIVARAFLITLSMLFIVALLGTAFGLALQGRFDPSVLVSLPKAHAVLGIGAWLSSLVFGVSARTMRAITGVVSRAGVLHISSSGFLLLGALLYTAAMAGGWNWAALAGGALLCLGALLYAFDLLDILRRRQYSNGPAQLFVLASDIWLFGCVALGAGTLAGKPWGAALTFLALAGWLGQMVNGHIFHVGVRLMITFVRGDEDETRPWQVLDLPLAVAAWMLSQAAIVLGTLALLQADARGTLLFAAICGAVGWIAMSSTILLAYRRLRRTAGTAIHAA